MRKYTDRCVYILSPAADVRNGDKRGFTKIRAADRQRWLEMGMVSLTIVGWTDVDGVLSVRT